MGTSNYYPMDKRDGYLQNTNANYATCRTAASATTNNYNGYSNIIVGQTTGYNIYRGCFYIDTSRIGAGSTITAASLWIYLNAKTGSSYYVQIQNGQPTYPADQYPADSDYDYTLYSGNGGVSADVGSLSTGTWIEIPLTSDGMSWINKTGITKFMLRSSKDIAGTTPTGNEYLTFRASDNPGDTEYYLSVTHDGPTQVTIPVAGTNKGSYVENTDTGWSTTRDATNGDLADTYLTNVGAYGSGTGRWVSRQALLFNTASIPSDATIVSAAVKVHMLASVNGAAYYQLQTHSDPGEPLAVSDYLYSKWTGDYGGATVSSATVPISGWRYFVFSDFSPINKGGETFIAIREKDHDIDNSDPGSSANFSFFGNSYDDGNHLPSLIVAYTESTTEYDTARLTDYAYRLFAHRTIKDATMFDNPDAAPISHIRLYDSNGDYIELPIMRSYNDATTPMFDDTGGSETDPVYTSVTQYYHDLNLVTEVPRFNKVFDISENTWGYAPASFSVADYELFNANGNVIADAADTTISGFTIAEGQRYVLRFKIRVFNDMVEQTFGENTRAIITNDGLKTVIRRVLQSGSKHEYSRAPTFIGVGAQGAYYISNGSDGRWYYDSSSATYTSVTSTIFPPASAADDCFVFCREETTDDDIEGIEFNLGTAGVLETTSTLIWEYYDTTSSWTTLYGVSDDTEQFQYDGIVRWETPTDVATDAELKSGTTGRYYRCRLVGGGFDTEPAVASATDIAPLVLRTVHSETGMILPTNRKMADLIITPATGHAAKVSAEFGPGGMVERTRSSDGTLLSKSYEPLREVALFTALGITDSEVLDLGSYTGAVSSNVINIPDTNPAPIKLFNAIKSDGTVFDVSDRFVEYTESGGNYVTVVNLPDGTYTLTYLGKDITPSITPQNILSVDGNVQNLRGPNSVWAFASERNPADSDSGADTAMTPRSIKLAAIGLYEGEGDGPMSPTFSRGPGDRGMVVSAADWGAGKIEKQRITAFGRTVGFNLWIPGGTYEFKFAPSYPMIMTRFNVSDMDRLGDPVFVISASGFVKYPEESNFSYHVMVWSEGDPAAESGHMRETGWKTISTSSPIAGSAGSPTNVTVKLPMKYRDEGDYCSSPYVDDSGDMYILVVSSDKTDGDKNLEISTTLRDQGFGWVWDHITSIGKSIQNKVKKQARQTFGDIGVGYIGMITNPVGDAGNGSFKFRRGVDWTYYLGDANANWRINGSNGGDPENYPVSTRDGATYLPVLPTARIGQGEEKYRFGVSPGTATTTLYLQHQPMNAGGVYVWLEGEETRIDNLNGGITVNYVGWDSDATWNAIDANYSDDHLQSASGGSGAGYINVTFTSKDWSASEFRDVSVRYLYYEAPELTMTYLHGGGKMFARAHTSDMSHNTVLNPAYGDRVRIYFEVQFEEKRSA